MKLKYSELLLLSILVVSFVSAAPLSKLAQTDSSIHNSSFQLRDINAQGVGETSPSAPSPDLGLANWTSNRFSNPGFESWSSPFSPDRWGAWSPGDLYHWYATAPWPVSEGSRSGGMQCRSSTGQPATGSWYQYSIDADMANLNLAFDWYLDQNPDPIDDYFYVQIYTSHPSYGTLAMYYFLNGSTSWSNSSSQVVYKTYGPSQQWNTFSRNLTKDFVSNQPYFPSSIPAGLEVDTIYFYIRMNEANDQYLRAFVDDVNLENETNAYVWIGPGTRNGNWEGTGSWQLYGNNDASSVSRSSMAHSGTWSVNLTVASFGNASYCDLETWPSVRMTAQNPGILSFWWYLSYQQVTPNSRIGFYMSFYNGTQYQQVYYWLGYGGASYSNSSHRLYIHVEGFNTTNTWMHCVRDVWADAAAYFGTDELFLDYAYFWAYTCDAGSRVTGLIDEATLEAAALNGAGFEDQRAVGSLARAFGWSYSSYNELTVTGTAYAGTKACNFTLANGASLNFYQDLSWRPLNGSRETYLDAMWRLEDYTPMLGDEAYLWLRFADGHDLYYFLALDSGSLPSNTSTTGFFNVTGANTMHAWVQLHRDLVHDYEAVFGSAPNTEIVYLYLGGYTSVGSRLVLLLDDLYLYDDPAPRLNNVQRSPLTPDHNQAVQVSAEAADQDLDTVLLYYRLNGGSWQNPTMAHQSGNTYAALISGQPHGTLVEYYVTANDTWGKTTTILDSGIYWSYTAWDQTPPAVAIATPTSGAVVNGTVGITVTATDSDSGITRVEFLIDGTSRSNDTTAPYTANWDTTTLTNGPHTITAKAFNGAGLSATATITVTVANATPPPIPGFPLAAIALALGLSISIGVLHRRHRH